MHHIPVEIEYNFDLIQQYRVWICCISPNTPIHTSLVNRVLNREIPVL